MAAAMTGLATDVGAVARLAKVKLATVCVAVDPPVPAVKPT